MQQKAKDVGDAEEGKGSQQSITRRSTNAHHYYGASADDIEDEEEYGN